MKKKEKDNRPICKKCGSRLVYTRISTGELVCRTCGFINNRQKRLDEVGN